MRLPTGGKRQVCEGLKLTDWPGFFCFMLAFYGQEPKRIYKDADYPEVSLGDMNQNGLT